jgi:hypothetical protein
LASNKALATAWGKALNNQITYASNLDRSLKSADADLKQVVDTFKGKVNDSSIPISNIITNYRKYGLGDSDISQYKASLKEIQRLYAQVFSTGGSVQGTNISAQDVIDGNISLDNLALVANQLHALGEIDVAQAYDAVKNSSTQIQNIVPTGGAGGTGGGKSNLDPRDLDNTFQKNSGADKFVSPQTWSKLENMYVQSGGDKASFQQTYGKYKNPNNPNYN